MPFVTPRISLKVWNSPSDPYNSQQLADNWIKVDLHDHSSGKGTQIGSGGIANNAILANHIFANAVGNSALADNAVGTSELQTASVTSPKLKPSYGSVTASGNLTLTTTATNIPGATAVVVPTVSSSLLVHGAFYLSGNLPNGSTAELEGLLALDGTPRTTVAKMYQSIAAGTTTAVAAATVYQSWIVPLTAASHTITLQGRLGSLNSGGATGTAIAANTTLTYILYAA